MRNDEPAHDGRRELRQSSRSQGDASFTGNVFLQARRVHFYFRSSVALGSLPKYIGSQSCRSIDRLATILKCRRRIFTRSSGV
jgi:hypothetical protein